MNKLIYIIPIIIFVLLIYTYNISRFSSENKLALIIHVGNTDVFKDIIETYPKFFNNNLDIYITYNDSNKYKIINSLVPNSTKILVENKGMDIGPFLLVVDYFKKNKLSYNYYIKIHTKSDKEWRNKLIKPIYNNLNLFLTNGLSNQVEMYGSSDYLFDVNFTYNYKYVLDILNRNYPDYTNTFKKYCINENTDTCVKKPYFVAGTIFVFNNAYMDLLKKMVDINYEYSILETGYIQNINEQTASKTHAWEYLFGYLIYLNNKEINQLK